MKRIKFGSAATKIPTKTTRKTVIIFSCQWMSRKKKLIPQNEHKLNDSVQISNVCVVCLCRHSKKAKERKKSHYIYGYIYKVEWSMHTVHTDSTCTRVVVSFDTFTVHSSCLASISFPYKHNFQFRWMFAIRHSDVELHHSWKL